MTVHVPRIMPGGRLADLAAFRPEDVDFAEVAAGLAKINRWSGLHGGAGISVAQHSVMGADALVFENGDQVEAGYFLLHDAHEYVLGDVCRPATMLLGVTVEARLTELFGADVGPAFRGIVGDCMEAAKADLDRAIHAAAGFRDLSLMPLYARRVRDMDERMCMAEAKLLYGATGEVPLVRGDLPPPRLRGALTRWPWHKAEEAFIARLERYCGIVVERPLI